MKVFGDVWDYGILVKVVVEVGDIDEMICFVMILMRI